MYVILPMLMLPAIMIVMAVVTVIPSMPMVMMIVIPSMPMVMMLVMMLLLMPMMMFVMVIAVIAVLMMWVRISFGFEPTIEFYDRKHSTNSQAPQACLHHRRSGLAGVHVAQDIGEQHHVPLSGNLTNIVVLQRVWLALMHMELRFTKLHRLSPAPQPPQLLLLGVQRVHRSDIQCGMRCQSQ